MVDNLECHEEHMKIYFFWKIIQRLSSGWDLVLLFQYEFKGIFTDFLLIIAYYMSRGLVANTKKLFL